MVAMTVSKAAQAMKASAQWVKCGGFMKVGEHVTEYMVWPVEGGRVQPFDKKAATAKTKAMKAATAKTKAMTAQTKAVKTKTAKKANTTKKEVAKKAMKATKG